ncbi:MAG: hypothetical protein GY786_16745 [Proteobacteria bacterium]|nr:hypothetical protein [Pseudomonadota bacterium]
MDQSPSAEFAEEQAYQLSKCAIAIDQARENPSQMAGALNDNLEVWVAIRTLAEQDSSPLAPEVRQNLATLSKFVADKVFSFGEGLSEETISTLININLQISEGLLEGASRTTH